MELILAYIILTLAYILIIFPIAGKSLDTFNNFSYGQMIWGGLIIHCGFLCTAGVLMVVYWAFNTISNL